jgi:selenocysteine lyase/cysteine desulfurase
VQVRKPLGSVRVSLGYMSRWEDVDAFARFLAATFTDKSAEDAPET